MSVLRTISTETIRSELSKCVVHASRYNWTISEINEESQSFTVSMTSPVDGQQYCIEFAYDNYPEWPVAIEFIDVATGQRGIRSAYPASGKKHGNFFHGKPCICHPCNRQAYAGYKSLHGEWQMAAWKNNPQVGTLTNLEAILLAIYHRLDNTEEYNGRMR